MNEHLLNIVNSRYSIEVSVDEKALSKYTRKADAFAMRWFDWSRIRHLHMLGSADFQEIDILREGKIKPGYYLDETQTWMLVIGASRQRILEHLSRCGDGLEVLSLRFTPLEEVDLTHLTGITTLDLSSNEHLCRVQGLDGLSKLRELTLSSTRIGPVLDLNPFESLVNVAIFGTPIQQIRLDHPLKNVRSFSAGRTAIQDTAFLTKLPGLRFLDLYNTPITDLPPMDSFSRRSWLVLQGTSIRRLPASFRSMKSIERLDLRDLKLEELPDWLPELGMEFNVNYTSGIDLRGTKVKGIDMSIFDQPQEVILKWFDERIKAKNTQEANAGAPLNEVKVVFLGDGEAGKSHTIARLLNDGGAPENFTGDSTPGIVITDKSYAIGERRVQVHFWDFGGQEILHSMHRMFLTERTLYVVLINARDDTQDDRARYWLHNIKSFANGAPVLLVLNKMDQNPNASVNESDLRAIYPGLTEVVKLSAMYDNREKFNAGFTEAMKRQIGAMKDLSFFFPASWTKVKHSLQGMTQNYIKGSDYAAICEDSGVQDQGDLRRSLLNWFNDLGISICYGGSVWLKDYVILRPNWITNAVYAILFNKHPDVENGIISHDAIFEMIQPPKEGNDPYRRTNPAEVYTQQEIEYILNVMRKFRLSFRVNDEQEFIPVLCQRESLPVAAEYAADPDALEFHMTFDYLPNNVLHRLMVELRQDLDTTRVWRTGAHFVQKSSGLSAVVKSEGNVLKIFVRSTRKTHKANTYLCILKDAVDHIVGDMNLEAPMNEVVYKLEGKRQAFDYDELVESQEHGETSRYSRAHKRRLQIEDILNQTGRGAEEEREQLLWHLVTACGQLQANRQNWGVIENVRNTYIRDLLRAMGYHVSDQTLSARSAGGAQAGELDLDIRREPNIPWTLGEAMNLSGKGKKQIAYWDEHLKRLLDNYNANGLPFLFLISYVDCTKDAFGGVAGAYYEHLRFHSPEKYALQAAGALPLGTDRYEQNHYIQAARCIYDRDGFPTAVYHLFVRMGE